MPCTVHCTMYNNLLHICKLCSVSIGRMSYLSLYIYIYLLRRLSLYPNSCPCPGRALTRPDCWPRGAVAARSRGRAGAAAACRRWGSKGRGRGCTPASRIGRPVGPAAEAAPGWIKVGGKGKAAWDDFFDFLNLSIIVIWDSISFYTQRAYFLWGR